MTVQIDHLPGPVLPNDGARNPRDLLTASAFEAVAATVQSNNPGMDVDVAERITAEALKFVAAAAVERGRGLRPSRTVDEGWHALILHTKVYAKLCARLGRFVHHVPERRDPTRHDAGALDRTQAAITAVGYRPDMTLWLGPTVGVPVAADCEHSGCSSACADCTGPCESTPN